MFQEAPGRKEIIGIIIRGGVARGKPSVGLGGAKRWTHFEAAKLDELRAAGESRTAFLLRFTLTHPHTHTIMVGTLQPEHLKEDMDALKRGPLPAKVYAEAKRRLDRAGITAQESE